MHIIRVIRFYSSLLPILIGQYAPVVHRQVQCALAARELHPLLSLLSGMILLVFRLNCILPVNGEVLDSKWHKEFSFH